MRNRELRIYSGRNRPDLTPFYRIFEGLTGIRIRVEKVYHLDVEDRIVKERSEPRADLLITNSQVAVEAVRGTGVFDPYQPEVARRYDAWLRAPDFAWLSFTAWPRSAMVNRSVLRDPAAWPTSIRDLAEPALRGKASIATVNEETTVSQFSAMRALCGDAWTWGLVDRLLANGLRTYPSNKDTREALIAERNAVAMVNSSNFHVFLMEGNPVGEAWLDQDEGGLGTNVEAHTVAVIKGCRHPEEARAFVDWLLEADTQSLLARMFGETPVNPRAEHATVRPLARIRRMDVPLAKLTELRDSTRAYLSTRGFAPTKG
ncbi:MAG TPA: extracellular solute-binding protein [Candidatus Limnocylindria bacterium]